MDFGELEDDKKIQEKLLHFNNSVNKISHILDLSLKTEVYEKLNVEEKVNYDLFMAYTLNTLFWIYLRTKGIDPNKNDVKNQLTRIRQCMVKAKQAHDRNTIRPVINKDVARRFIKHGTQQSEGNTDEPPTKRTK